MKVRDILIGSLLATIFTIVFFSLLFSTGGCGGNETILTPIEQEEPSPESQPFTPIITGSSYTPESEEPEEECPADYRDDIFVIVDCDEYRGLVAVGEGCLKSLRLMTDEEFNIYCPMEE